MTRPLTDRMLALAGLVQALAQVRRIADTGQAHAEALQTALESVFRIDSAGTAEVYGDASRLQPGLALLRDYFTGASRDPQLPRLALAVMQLERRFVRDESMGAKVQAGLRRLSGDAERQGVAHPEVLAALGRLYADTLSQLRPRVLVQGNPHYLGQAQVVAEVRAVLLAAMRSAVLWRQMGGSLWDFMLRRREMASTVEALLGER